MELIVCRNSELDAADDGLVKVWMSPSQDSVCILSWPTYCGSGNMRGLPI